LFTKSAVVDSTTVVSPFFNVYVTFFVEKSTVALSVTQPVASLFKELKSDVVIVSFIDGDTSLPLIVIVPKVPLPVAGAAIVNICLSELNQVPAFDPPSNAILELLPLAQASMLKSKDTLNL